jgi:very-short-patch-repair endonuclease
MRGKSHTEARDLRIADLARRQHGVVTRRQLLAGGGAAAPLDRWLRSGRLHRLHAGVFALGHRAIRRGTREMAAVLACGAAAVVSHRSAAALWGLLDHLPIGSPVTVTLVGGGPHRRRGIDARRVRTLDPHDRRTLHGIPVTSPARTILDLAAELNAAGLERVIAEGLRKKLFTEHDLDDQLARNPGRAGTAALRTVLDRAGGPKFTRSHAERVLLTALRNFGLREPELNARVCGYEVDFLWRREQVVVEVDGYRYHADRWAFESDRERTNTLQLQGYTVLRVTWQDLTARLPTVIARIRSALRRG